MFEDAQPTLNAAQAGLGLALLRAPLISRELASGELVKLFWTTAAITIHVPEAIPSCHTALGVWPSELSGR